MILEGKVKSGLGEAGFWVKKIAQIFEQKENIKLFSGTLNIELNNNYEIVSPDIIVEKEEYGGTEKLFIKRCKVLGHNSYIIRTEKNSSQNGDHPLNIIEILSDVNFRKKYNLVDKQEIAIFI